MPIRLRWSLQGGFWDYRTKRVGFMVTFRLAGAEKLVLKVVGVNYENGQIVLLAG